MRDPNRLDNFYETMKELHKTYVPDWRFGQLIENFKRWNDDKDIFFIEENSLLEDLRDFLTKITKGDDNNA